MADEKSKANEKGKEKEVVTTPASETKEDDIQIVDEVIAIISGIAASKVDGIKGMSGTSFVGNIAERMGKKDLAKGVTVEKSEDDEVFVTISVIVQYGKKIHVTAKEVQKVVRDAIQSMTGLDVPAVKVNVKGVELESEEPAEEA